MVQPMISIRQIKAFMVAPLLLALSVFSNGPVLASPTVVVELFTSQGCSSCPPADRILHDIRSRDNILALSWPVDYWDRLGWEDTFAHPRNSMRQTAYNKRFGMSGVYTPQMVMNGVRECVGSRRDDVEEGLKTSFEEDERWHVPELTLSGKTLQVTLPNVVGAETVMARIVYYTRDAEVQVNDGENEGRRLSYANVVRHTSMIEDWDGSAATLTLDVQEGLSAGADHVVILLQDGYRHGPIIGAAAVEIIAPTKVSVGR